MKQKLKAKNQQTVTVQDQTLIQFKKTDFAVILNKNSIYTYFNSKHKS